MDKELFYLLGLNQIKGIGDVRGRKLLEHFGSAEAIFNTSSKALKEIEVLDTNSFANLKKGFDEKVVEKELNFIQKNNIQVHSFLFDSFPKKLKEIPDCPFILFSKGKCSLNDNRTIAIVGSRNNTPIGKSFTEQFINDLKEFQPTIVSGLAYGIDIIAHKAAVEAGLPTIGVLAHGLDMIYPAVHRKTATEMLDNGGLLTEYCSGTIPDKPNFPSRNRIVAGLCDATIVIETDIKGGAMITAKLALSYNRDVFAVPGRYNDIRSKGCNYLIKTNIAQLLTEVNDLAEFLNWDLKKINRKRIQQKLFADFSKEEMDIIKILEEKETIHIDEFQIKTRMNNTELATILLQLEFSNTITSLPGKRYKLN
ncbi:MAG TPA: DNA-processing protein DprA [Edaphocola sp.]|nr:DNA-processing protein DprA [Edaphocola sp.]